MQVQWFNQPSDIVKVLEERLRGTRSQLRDDEVVDFIDIGNSIGVNPDNRNDVEEIPPFVVKLGIGKDSVIDALK